MSRFTLSLTQLEQALDRLQEALALPESDIVRDSAIHRFEFTLDLAWKTVKAYLEEEKGIIRASPKDCFREAFAQGLLEPADRWIAWVDLRNQTTHTYSEALAKRVYRQILDAVADVEKLVKSLKQYAD